MMDFTISPLTFERWPALEDLFGRAGASHGPPVKRVHPVDLTRFTSALGTGGRRRFA
jgi:hypothetical protein